MRTIDADALLDAYDAAHEGPPGGARKLIENAPTVGGWISVKDRLPEERINPLTQDFAEVICFCDFGGEPRRTDVRTYKFGKPTWDKDGHFLHGGQIMDGVITHWQYLPEPPKEEDDEHND